MRRNARTTVIVTIALVTLLMTACERPPWAQFGYDAGHARATTDN